MVAIKSGLLNPHPPIRVEHKLSKYALTEIEYMDPGYKSKLFTRLKQQAMDFVFGQFSGDVVVSVKQYERMTCNGDMALTVDANVFSPSFLRQDFVYVFEVLWNRHECNWTTVSLHKTKQSAYVAMREFLFKEYNEWRNSWFLGGRAFWNRGSKYEPAFDGTRIRKVRVLGGIHANVL